MRKQEEQELQSIAKRITEWTPSKEVEKFADLPITEATLKGLKGALFVKMTDVQRKTIIPALKGEDIMATAKTGLGKTLAFLVPVIEALNRALITEFDGLAALIVSPTRELAVQIFEVLTKIGKYNTFSAGLVTGGKDVKFEKDRVSKMNILVGTPGRISQHLNEAVGMETLNLQVLVLDEADRCLDMGFKRQIDSIVAHLPLDRQTLLFSATTSDLVQDLARLLLVNPKKIGVSQDESATPDTLDQYYVKVPLEEKLDILWSFIKLHLKLKILVFFSSSKQVQYAYESFRHLQPGISLLKLYGRHKQTLRIETTVKFSHAQYACLFATDIVARGLDFPLIDWVIQLDCPEDAQTYVHRVGRAARFGKLGKSLLMLTPTEEEPFLAKLKAVKIEPKLMNIKGKAKKSIRPQLQSLCFHDPILKNLAQRAFISYFRSVYVQKDKNVFSVESLPVDKFASLLGLPGAPKIKLGLLKNDKKNENRKLKLLELANDQGDIVEEKKQRTKYDRMFERQNQTVLSLNFRKMTEGDSADESDDDFMTVKRKDHHLEEDTLPDLSAPVSKRSAKTALSKAALAKTKGANPTKLKFDDDGVAHPLYELQDEEDFAAEGDASELKAEFVAKEGDKMAYADFDDKLVAKQKKQEKKRKRKEAERRAWEDELEEDMEEGEEQQDRPKRAKWWKEGDEAKRLNEVIEVEQPETVEDLEALAERLIG